MELHTALAFFFSSRRRHTRSTRDWSSDVCSSDLGNAHRHGCWYEHRDGKTRKIGSPWKGLAYPTGSNRRGIRALPGKAWRKERRMTTTIALWLILLCIGLLTYATRLSFILLFGKVEVPVFLQHAL